MHLEIVRQDEKHRTVVTVTVHDYDWFKVWEHASRIELHVIEELGKLNGPISDKLMALSELARIIEERRASTGPGPAHKTANTSLEGDKRCI